MENRRVGTASKRAAEKNEKEKNDRYAVRFVAVQAAVCAVILLICFLMMKSGGTNFEKLKEEFSYAMNKDITVKEAVDAFNEIKNFVFSPSDYWTAEAEKPSQGSQESESGGMGGAPDAAAYKNSSLAPFQTTVKASLPLKGKLTSPFGVRTHPVTGKKDFHTGIDLAAPEGADVCSAFFGVVTELGCDEAYGNYIKVSHGDGMETFYAHCSEILAEKNAVIRAGEVIAKVGSTGISTGPHLHFEIRIDSVRYNPLPLLEQYRDDISN